MASRSPNSQYTHAVTLWFRPEDVEKIKAAARADERPLSTMIRRLALQGLAELEKSS